MKELTRLLTVVNFSAENGAIDSESGIIRGVNVISQGEAKGHGMVVDALMLSQVKDAGNRSKNGIKSRLGHPEIFGSSIGTLVGRFKNFAIDGEDVKADLHLSESAKKSPKGNLWDYVLALAKSDADMCGMSISFEMGESEFDKDGIEHCRLSALNAVDLVDEPAATSGIFDAKNSTKTLQITTNKEIFAMAENEIKKELETAKIELAELRVKVDELGKQVEAKDAELSKLKTDSEAYKAEHEKKVAELNAKAENDRAEFDKKTKDQSEKLSTVESELATFKKGAAPIVTKPNDEPIAKKSIFKNIQ